MSEKAGMWSSLKGKAGAILAAVLILAWLVGIGMILGGLLLGTGLVIFMMLTLERIPKFWWFATHQPGTILTIIGTLWLSHAMFGTDTLMGMTAFIWSGILKVIVIDGVKRQRLQATN